MESILSTIELAVTAALTEHAGHIETRSGYSFYFDDPNSWRFSMQDIAGSLSRLNRYVGHTLKVYSVAEHSLWVSKWLELRGESVEVQLHGLIHDMPEAYTGDINSPLKNLPANSTLRRLEDDILDAAYLQMGWPVRTPQDTRMVKLADRIALLTEYRDLKGGRDFEFLPPVPIRPQGDYAEVERKMMRRYRDLEHSVFLKNTVSGLG